MLPKYKVEFGIRLRDKIISHDHATDDPVSCQRFLADLLKQGFKILDVKHDGVSLPKNDFNRLIKTAANLVASDQICTSLDIKPEEEKFRFGFAA